MPEETSMPGVARLSPDLASGGHPSDLYPLPFPVLVRRLLREIDAGGPIYEMSRSAVWAPDPSRDLSTTHFGAPVGTPLGPASGPHTQLAQNLLLCWLGGARFLELKTVQVADSLRIPRPCIHVPHVGWNVEWSQELRVAESAREYAKGWLLIHLAAERLGLAPDVIFDLSLGYDLPGISGPKIQGFVKQLCEAGPLLDALNAELPPALRIAAPRSITRSVTLSTFHGCPADEIDAIARHCMEAFGLDTIVKLNPTLLGLDAVRHLLHERLGYHHVCLDSAAFEKDLTWEALEAMVPRLQEVALRCGVGFGVKFSNTLVCRSEETPFGGGDVYLSGAPLHVLAASLAARFMNRFPGIPVSFSGGVDASNFPDVVAAGIRPVTTCSDLLKGKGYGKLAHYLRNLERRMAAGGHPDIHSLTTAGVVDASAYAAQLPDNPLYHQAQNRKAPRKVGSPLALLDCLTCDKCIPVCPNAAIFTFALPFRALPGGRLRWSDAALLEERGPPLPVTRRHQIGITADACNLCGQCDPTCPEDGGPFAVKPLVFLDGRAWAEHPERDGFHRDARALLWRRQGVISRWDPATETLEVPGGTVRFTGETPVAVTGCGEVSLADAALLRSLSQSLSVAWQEAS